MIIIRILIGRRSCIPVSKNVAVTKKLLMIFIVTLLHHKFGRRIQYVTSITAFEISREIRSFTA